jgi:hypothetical protein
VPTWHPLYRARYKIDHRAPRSRIQESGYSRHVKAEDQPELLTIDGHEAAVTHPAKIHAPPSGVDSTRLASIGKIGGFTGKSTRPS